MKLKALSENSKRAIEAEFQKYPDKRSCLLAALRIAQEEIGYLSEPAMVDVAELLDLTPVQVYDVATFYTLYNLTPVGKHLIQVCKTLSCALVGAGPLIGHLQERLGIQVGGTTSDGFFSLKLVECLASCGSGPMMQINDQCYENLTPEKVDRILDDLRKGGKSPLASGPYQIPLMQIQ